MANIFKKLFGKLKKEEPAAAPAPAQSKQETPAAPTQPQPTAPNATAAPETRAEAKPQEDKPAAVEEKAEPKKPAPKQAAPADAKPTAPKSTTPKKAPAKTAAGANAEKKASDTKTATAAKKTTPKTDTAKAPATTTKKQTTAKTASVTKSATKAQPASKAEEVTVKAESVTPAKEEKAVKAEPTVAKTDVKAEKPVKTVPKKEEVKPAVAEAPTPAQTTPVVEESAVGAEESAASAAMLGKFFIKQAKDGSYMFNLKASNGSIIATSDMYSTMEKCKKGIASVQMNAPIANFEDHTVDGAVETVVNPKFEMYYDKGGEFRFRLKAKNGSIIAKSQGYTNKPNCLNGIESVRKNAMSDVIVDEDALAAEQAAVEAEIASAVEEPAVEPAAEVPAVEEESSSALMGKFCIKVAKDGSYMFNLKASNGSIIATSDMYSTMEKCKKGIASVQLNAPIANFEDHTVEGAVETVVNPKFEMYYDKGGEFRFRLKAKNGSIIAKSQGYTNKPNCLNGIESVRKNAMTDVVTMEDNVTQND